MTDIIKKSGVKARCKANGVNISSKATEKLDALVCSIVDEACQRSKANKRKTLMLHDV